MKRLWFPLPSQVLRHYKYFATFDFESFFTQEQLPNNTEKLTWENKHQPLSASICSNVPGFTEPQCLITNGDSHDLLERFIVHLEEVSQESYRLLLNDFQEVFTAIDEKIAQVGCADVNALAEVLVSLVDDSDDSDSDDDDVIDEDEVNDRGVDVLESDDDDEEAIDEENDEDRAFIDDGSDDDDDNDVNFYRALDQELGVTVRVENRGEAQEKQKKKKHPLVKLKVCMFCIMLYNLMY